MKAINRFLFHPKPFPYLERISLKEALLKFPNMLYSSSQKCNIKYEPSKIGFLESLSCLRILITDHLNFTIEMGERDFFYLTSFLNSHYDFIHNQMVWYKNPQFPFHEIETYCSQRLNEFELKILIRKPRPPISILEAIQLPFCSLTWTSIFIASAGGVFFSCVLRKSYNYFQNSTLKIDLV